MNAWKLCAKTAEIVLIRKVYYEVVTKQVLLFIFKRIKQSLTECIITKSCRKYWIPKLRSIGMRKLYDSPISLYQCIAIFWSEAFASSLRSTVAYNCCMCNQLPLNFISCFHANVFPVSLALFVSLFLSPEKGTIYLKIN